MKNTIAILIVILAVNNGFSQAPSKKLQSSPAAAAADKIYKLQRSRAVAMVEKTATEATSWKDRKLAAEALTDSARLLWKENPARAAGRLRLAWQITIEMKERSDLEGFLYSTERSRLRTGVLGVALDNDRKLFEDLIKQIRTNETHTDKGYADRENRMTRSQLFLDLAIARIGRDPNLAFDLASRGIADGMALGLERFLTALRKKDVNLTNRLFDMALARLKDPSADPIGAMVLSSYMFRPGYLLLGNRIFDSSANTTGAAPSEPARAQALLRAIYLRFFATLTPYMQPENEWLAENTLQLGDQLWAQYKKYLPEFAQPVGTFLGFLKEKVYEGSQPWTGREETVAKETAEERYKVMIDRQEQQADRAPLQSSRDRLYLQTSILTKQSDLARALSIAAKIEDEERRFPTISFLHYRAALDLVRLGNTRAAEELLPMILEPIRHALVQVCVARSLAGSLENESSPDAANRTREKLNTLLGSALEEIKTEEPSSDIVRLMFGTITVILKYDELQAKAMLERALEMLDNVPNYDLKGNYAPELRFEVKGVVSTLAFARPFDGFGFRNAVEPLIARDFDRIALLVEKLSSVENRGVARLEIAKLFLRQDKPAAK